MPLTRLDCYTFSNGHPEGDAPSYVLFNPLMIPGKIVMGCSRAARNSLGGQVAATLALEHFVNGIFDTCSKTRAQAKSAERDLQSIRLLEDAFRISNNSVYTFGHRLAAGGKMAAAMLGLVLIDDVVSVGRVGMGIAYLLRSGKVFPFFQRPSEYIQNMHAVQNASVVLQAPHQEGLLDLSVDTRPHDENNLVAETHGNGSLVRVDYALGINSNVSVEIASVKLEENDTLLILTSELVDSVEKDLFEEYKKYFHENNERFDHQTAEYFSDLLTGHDSDPPNVFMIHAGPQTCFLSPSAMMGRVY